MRAAFLQEVQSGTDKDRLQVVDVLLAPGNVLLGQQCTWRGIEHELGHLRSLQALAVFADRSPNISGFSANRCLSRETPHRYAALACPEGLAVIVHLLFSKLSSRSLRQ